MIEVPNLSNSFNIPEKNSFIAQSNSTHEPQNLILTSFPIQINDDYNAEEFSLRVQSFVRKPIPDIGHLFVRGDVDGDSSLSHTDTLMLLRERGKPVTGMNDLRDINQDRKIDILDVRELGLLIRENIDLTAPYLSGSLINNTGEDGDDLTSDPTIRGSLTDGSEITRFLGGINTTNLAEYQNLRGLLNADGTFSISPGQLATLNGSDLTNGLYTLHLYAKDRWGNESFFDIPIEFDIQTPPPPVLNLLASSDTGNSDTDNLTNDTTPTLQATGEVNSTVKLFQNGKEVEEITTNELGLAEFTLETLTDGIYSFTAITRDLAGNVSETSSTLIIEIDTVAPNTPIFDLDPISDSDLEGDQQTTSSVVTLVGQTSASQIVRLVETEVEVISNELGEFQFDNVVLTLGSNHLTTQVTDIAGNSNTHSQIITRLADNQPPVINAQVFAIDENSPNNTVVGRIIATDPDFGDSLTYRLVGDSEVFSISSTGQITVVDSTELDFETTPSFSLDVQVTDNGNLMDTEIITINLNDLGYLAQLENVQTKRIVQLTGDYDPENLPHFNNTLQWGVEGTDLGANTEHEGKLFIFFGDVPQVPPNDQPIKYDADFIAYINNIEIPPGGNLIAAKQLDNQFDVNDQLNTFFIGNDGGLYVSWVIDKEEWQGPIRITPANFAPPGGSIASIKQFDDQLNAFFIGNDGGLYVSWVTGTGAWNSPIRITPANFAPPGGSIASIKQFDDQLNAFFIGNDGGLYVSWVTGTGAWNGPIRITPANFAPPGGSIASIKQFDDQLNAFFIGNDGGLYVSWVTGTGAWNGPIRITPANFAPPGGSIASIKQFDDQLNAFFIGNDGGLYVSWVTGTGAWNGPIRITPANFAPPGGSIASIKQFDDQLNAFFIGNDGGLYVSWFTGTGAWNGPIRITPTNVAPPGAGVTSAKQLDDQLNVFFIGHDGKLHVSWVVGKEAWQGPLPIIPAPFRLTPVLENELFYPFTIREENGDEYIPGTNETPTGAFSYDDKVYVFYITGGDAPVSILTSSPDPTQPHPYNELFQLSTNDLSQSGRFWQIAPYVVRNADFPELPTTEGDGLIMFGHGIGDEGKLGVHLAWMPLELGQEPRKSDIHFYTGDSWSNNEVEAKTLFDTKYWTTLSVGTISETGHWILLYQQEGSEMKIPGSFNNPIVARIAETPFEIGKIDNVDEIPIFDPIREEARGRYMATNPELYDKGWRPVNHPSFAYGAFLLNPYTQWDAETHIATINYLMSTGYPYQVQVMQSQIPFVEG
jgi:hypothetical protein